MNWESVADALLLSAGYNAALVAVGAALVGVAAGGAGVFLLLRKRALVSDAAAHATLPGVCLAFLIMTALGGDGRDVLGLLIGSAAAAALGVALIDWMTRRTRLGEDAAIGAVLSVFFGFGVVLLTLIQSAPVGRRAGLQDYLLGSTAGMLWEDAVVLAIGGVVTIAAALWLRRPMTLAAFDPDFAAASGWSVSRIDLATMALAGAAVVIGLKVVGLVMIVALLIIPAVAARFWTDRIDRLFPIACLIGGASGYFGAALSIGAPALPTGPIIVLVCAAAFAVSLFCAPNRGVAAAVWRRRRFQRRVHLRQGLLALARGEPIFDGLTLRVLRNAGLIRSDGVPTERGRAQAAKADRDEARWAVARAMYAEGDAGPDGRRAPPPLEGLAEIEDVLTPDEIAEIDRRLGGPRVVSL